MSDTPKGEHQPQSVPSQSLKGRIALVTGATRQVGRSVAVGLAEAGPKSTSPRVA